MQRAVTGLPDIGTSVSQSRRRQCVLLTFGLQRITAPIADVDCHYEQTDACAAYPSTNLTHLYSGGLPGPIPLLLLRQRRVGRRSICTLIQNSVHFCAAQSFPETRRAIRRDKT